MSCELPRCRLSTREGELTSRTMVTGMMVGIVVVRLQGDSVRLPQRELSSSAETVEPDQRL